MRLPDHIHDHNLFPLVHKRSSKKIITITQLRILGHRAESNSLRLIRKEEEILRCSWEREGLSRAKSPLTHTIREA